MICSILSASLWSALIFAAGVAIIQLFAWWAKKDQSRDDWQGWDENSYS